MLNYSMMWQHVVAAVEFVLAVALAVVIAKKLKPYCTLKTLCLSVLSGVFTGTGLMCYVSSVFAGMGENKTTAYMFLAIGIACLIALIVTVILLVVESVMPPEITQ